MLRQRTGMRRYVRAALLIVLLLSVLTDPLACHAESICLHHPMAPPAHAPCNWAFPCISALFAADPKACVYYDIHTIFTQEDIPGYHFARPSDCAQCQAGEPLDAIVNSGGYTVL